MTESPTDLAARLDDLLAGDERPPAERRGLARLMATFASLPAPPDPHHLYPRYSELHRAFLGSLGDAEEAERTFTLLYAHLHGYEVPFTPAERRRFEALDGYLNHVGGLSPVLRAGPFVGPDSVCGDFGAGNGLQGLLLQVLFPHLRTVQVELSSRLVDAGRHLQRWLGVPTDRVEWVVGDILDVSPTDMDFVYLYRPVRPEGPGRVFYERFGAALDRSDRDPVVFSVADALGPFLSDRFEVLFGDGHLTCFQRVR